jgi:CDP-diacylglycerol--glycerol-3-phosphate 3-phosphatidyltransferase
MDLYAPKGAINARLRPLVDRLAGTGVSPDVVTLAAVPVSALGAAALLASPGWPWSLVAVPLLCAARLFLNLLDGQLARSTGRTHARGELYNEVGDRIADVLFLAPVAWLPGAQPFYVLLGVVFALLASYVGVTARAAGGARIYRGVLSKPGRMLMLSVFALMVLAAGPTWWFWFGPLLLLGTAVTFLERVYVAVRRLP